MSVSVRTLHAASLAAALALSLWGAWPPGGPAPSEPLEQAAEAVRQRDREAFRRQVDEDQLIRSAAQELAKTHRLKALDLRLEAGQLSPPSGEPMVEALEERIEADLRQQLDLYFSARRKPEAPPARRSPEEGPWVSMERDGQSAQLHLKIRLSGPKGPLPVDVILQPSPETGKWKATELKQVSVGVKKSARF